MKTKTLAVNGLVAALYVAVTIAIAPIAFGSIQYRVSELFNHLVVFNKKYIYGIVVGVFLANLFLSTIKLYDLTFGVAHSIICLLITIGISKFVENHLLRMIINTLVFTFNMFIIAYQLHLALGFPFLITWGTTAIGEFVVMAIGIPIMHFLNKRISFGKLLD